jgi:hypothetical protein
MDKKDESGFGDDLTDFGMPVDLQIPDFSEIGKAFRLFAWLPALVAGVMTFIFSFIALVVYNGIFNATYNMTYDSFMWIVMLPFIAGFVVLFLVRLAVGRKAKGHSPFQF